MREHQNDPTVFFPQIFLYDGKTGEKIGSVGGEKAHEGGIYAVSLLYAVNLQTYSVELLLLLVFYSKTFGYLTELFSECKQQFERLHCWDRNIWSQKFEFLRQGVLSKQVKWMPSFSN